MADAIRVGAVLGALLVILSTPAPASGIIERQCGGDCVDGGVVTCEGDCNGNGRVTIDELLAQVNIAHAAVPPETCPNRCEAVDVACLVRSVGAALSGCGLRALIDQCRGAGIVRPNGGGVGMRLRRATREPREPVPGCGCAEPIGVAWLRVISPLTGTAIVTLTEPGSAIALGVYSPLCAAAEEQACVEVAPDGSGRLAVPMQEEEEVAIAVAVCDPPPEFVRMHVDLCGDGVISHREECDDGDVADGDDCTADCRFADLGGIDEWWIGPRGSCVTSSSSSDSVPIPTEAGLPVAQIITPAADTLAGVDVSITSRLRFGDSLSLIVRSGSVDGPVLARVDQLEPEVRSAGWNHFRLATPIALAPGQPYALQLAASAPGASWASRVGYDGQGCTAARYPGGPAIRDGEERPLSFLFRTYTAAP